MKKRLKMIAAANLGEPTKKHIGFYKAGRSDKARIIEIMCASFKDDPHTNWMLERCKNPTKLMCLMHYIFEKIIRVGDIYLSNDKNAVALWKSNKKEKFTYEYVLRDLRLLRQVGVRTVIRLLKNEKFTAKQYPPNTFYYHLYLIGVMPESQGKGYASMLLNPILKEMEKKTIPVYLETANQNNVLIYAKKGFKLYNTWFQKDFQLFYMKKE